MTGPEHYSEAERLLTEAAAIEVSDDDPASLPYVARAQVHATLALAAATALNPTGEDFVPDRNWTEFSAWARVCAVSPPIDEELARAAAPLVPAVETQETVS
jgi:hypothetical protein